MQPCMIIAVIIIAMVVLVIVLNDAIKKDSGTVFQEDAGQKDWLAVSPTNIPLKVNTAGVIPVIFASSSDVDSRMSLQVLQGISGYRHRCQDSDWMLNSNQLV